MVVSPPLDVCLGSVSPDGHWIAYSQEQADATYYRRNAMIAAIDGTVPRQIYEGAGLLHGPIWAPDQQLLSILLRGREDTLKVLTTDGKEIAAWTEGQFDQQAWCAPHRLVPKQA